MLVATSASALAFGLLLLFPCLLSTTVTAMSVEVKPTDPGTLLDCAVVAKPCAWISVDKDNVALLEGYNVANMSPPKLMMATDALPDKIRQALSVPGTKVTLSCASLRERHSLGTAHGSVCSFAAMKLNPCPQPGYPPAVDSAPIQMLCHVSEQVDLGEGDKWMVFLGIDKIRLKREVLTVPTGGSGERQITALVDVRKMQPVASLANGQYGTLRTVHTLLRPSKSEKTWVSDPFVEKAIEEQGDASGLPDVMEWDTTQPSPLGFNPIKAIVLPRPIGWISTYHPATVPHVAPYSFYINVARDMVAFAVYRPPNEPLKDAQLDVEETKCFGASTVTSDLVEGMNLSSAPISREQSEFDLSRQLVAESAKYISAPLVQGAKCHLECQYVKTVDAGGFSVVIGKIVSMTVSQSVLTEDASTIDATLLKPITRGGYVDEYAVIDQIVS